MIALKTGLYRYKIQFGTTEGKEKVIIIDRKTGSHYTLIFKGEQKTVDFHRKDVCPINGTPVYEQFFEMRTFTVIRLFALFLQVNNTLMRKYWFAHRINLGKLGRYKMIAFPTSVAENNIDYFITYNRKTQFQFAEEINLDLITGMMLPSHELNYTVEKAYWVYSAKNRSIKKQGIIFKQIGDKREKSFYFVSNKNFNEYIKAGRDVILNTIQQLHFKNKEFVLNYLAK